MLLCLLDIPVRCVGKNDETFLLLKIVVANYPAFWHKEIFRCSAPQIFVE